MFPTFTVETRPTLTVGVSRGPVASSGSPSGTLGATPHTFQDFAVTARVATCRHAIQVRYRL